MQSFKILKKLFAAVVKDHFYYNYLPSLVSTSTGITEAPAKGS